MNGRSRARRIEAGQRFWDIDHQVFILVTRVALDGSWVDIRVAPPGVPEAGFWGKRQRLIRGWFPFQVVRLDDQDPTP